MVKKAKKQNRQWRKIDTQDVDDFLEKSTREAQQGLVVDAIPDADLFFVDKAPDEDVSASVKAGILPKKLQHRNRLTRAQAILQAAQNVKPVGGNANQKRKRPNTTSAEAKATKAPRLTNNKKKAQLDEEPSRDLWAEKEVIPADPNIKNKVLITHPSLAGGTLVPVAKRKQKAPKHNNLPSVPAVIVDHPGCSYNPDAELHQDAIAEAVAAELKKQQEKMLAPTAPLRLVDPATLGEQDELLLLQNIDSDDEEGDGEQQSDEDNSEDDDVGRRSKEPKRKTQKDRNREARAKAIAEELERRRQEKRQRRDLEALPVLKKTLEEDLAEKEERRKRRQADYEEKRANEPPRLSKHKFEPMPLQVLTTDEVTGSLRRLKPTPMLTKDRFKSLQRRGIIEPRTNVNKSGAGSKRKTVTRGERQDKALERQAELDELKKERKKVAKVAKKSKTMKLDLD